MSGEAREWVWDHSSSRGAARLVMLSIADRVADEQCVSWASLSSLAKRTRASVSTVREAIDRLVDAGELEQLDDLVGPQRSTVYRLPLAAEAVAQARRAQQQGHEGDSDTAASDEPAAPSNSGSQLCADSESAPVRCRNPLRGSGNRQYRKPAGPDGNRHLDVPETGTAMYRKPAHRTVVNRI